MPDVAVLAFALPLLNGIELTREIRTHLPKTEIVIFTQHNIEVETNTLLQAGARAWVHKSEPVNRLIEVVQSATGHKGLRPTAGRKPNGSGPPLTTREREIVKLIAEGHNNKAVAKFLGVSFRTVDTHRLNIKRKLD